MVKGYCLELYQFFGLQETVRILTINNKVISLLSYIN